MVATIVISVLTIISLIVTVLVKPYVKIGKFNIGLYYIVCLVGAVLILVFGGLPIDQAVKGITASTSVNPLKILALFMSMTMLSIFLGNDGFFDLVAEKVFLKTKGSYFRLFLILFLVVAVLTAFTSNDIIILTFTPPICIFAKKAKISPLPFLFGEFVAANTFSMFLVVGNPTNIYLATSYGITFFDYFCKMVLPALCCGIATLTVTILIFKKSLKSGNAKTGSQETQTSKVQIRKVPMIVALCHLGVCIIMLAVSDILGIEMYLICVSLFLSLFLFNIVYEIITEKSVKRTLKTLLKAPFELIPFILSMFIIVLALSYNGVTEKIARALITNTKTDGVVFGFLSAISSNFLNNIPMSVLFEKIISGQNLHAILGTVIGSNVGAIITPLGALAGIMWNRILSNYGERLSFIKFFKYGSLIALSGIVFGTLPLFIL